MFTSLRRAASAWPKTGVATLLCGLFLSFIAPAQLPTGFVQSRTQSGYVAPMGVIFTPDGQRQFVWDKSGKVWVSVWNGTQYVKQTTAVLDISEEVGDWRDFGLLSLCLDPNYAQNGLIYLFYMVDRHHLFNAGTAAYNPATNEYYKATISRVTRYKFETVGGVLTANASSRQVLLGETKSTGVPLTHESHAGGTLVFGRDGSLMLTTGDNASYASTDKGSASETYFQQAITDGIMRANENVGSFRSQMLNSHCGKVLRMDPATGNGLASNPYFDAANPRSAQSRVWAFGLRNPYRMTIQPNTGSTNIADGNPGTLLIGDVGWGTWEDMHVIRQAGENAGWPIFEGLDAHPGYQAAAATLENKDEPNPSNTCNKPFLTFGDLLKQPTNPVQTVLNPCSNQPLPGLQRRYIHARPAIDWNHSSDIARTPTFNGAVATATNLGATGGVPGSVFRGNCATGGAYYPAATQFPTAWRNTYYFADYGANWIRAATLDANGAVTQVRQFLPNGGGNGLVDVEFNPLDGALYYININAGELMKISYGGNQPPVAVATSSTLTGPSPLTVSFRGDASSDPDNDPLTYAWDFGDGTSSALANPTKVFSATSSRGFTVRLTVSDGRGLSDSKTLQVSINNPAPTARITNPGNNALYPLDRESQYTLAATVTDDDLPGLTYAWQVILRHNNHEHREPIQTTASPTITVSPVGCDGETYLYIIKLTVTDRGGLVASDSVKIYPDCNSAKLSITNLQATTATNAVRLNWTNPAVAFDNVLVVAKAGSGFTDRPTDPAYTADANFTGSGAAFFGGKVVYQGVATSLVVTNLTAGQNYFFRVYTRRGTAWTGGVETSATPATPPAPPVSASITPAANTCYRLVARVSGMVLGVENGAMTDGGTIRQRTDANLLWQQWKFVPTSNGYYQVIANHSGKVLDVSEISTADNALVHQWGYVGGENQQWKLQYDAQGYYQLVVRHSGKMLDVKAGNQTEGGEIVQNTASGATGQQWSIEQRTCVNTAPVCGLSSGGLGSVACNNNATTNTTTDDYVTFVLNPTGTNLGSGYTVSVSMGTVSPATANYGVATTFRLQSGSAGTTNPTLTVTDNSNSTCLLSVVLTNPGTCSTPPPPVSASITPAANTCYRLVARVSGMVLGVEANSTANGGAVRQRTDANQSWQQWKFAPTSNGYYQVIANHSGKVLDVSGVSTADNALVHQWSYVGGNNQQWKLQYDAQGYYQLVARHSNKLLDVKASNQTEGGEIIQYTANGTTAQQWSIEARTCVNTASTFSPTACYRINARNGGKVLAVLNGSTTDGTQIRQQTYASRASQQWKIQVNAEGFYRLLNVNSNKSIDVPNSSAADQVNLVQWTSHNDWNQQWKVTRDATGYYVLTARHSGKAIALKNGNQIENGEIVQFTANGTTTQEWTIQAVTCAAPGARMATDVLVIPMLDSFTEPTDGGFKLYPNPAQHVVNVDLRAANGQPVTVALTDLTGRTLYKQNVDTSSESQHAIATASYSDGVYLISVKVSNGTVAMLRLVIAR